MRTITAILFGAIILAGCASFQEAYHTDRNYGVNYHAMWDKQIAYPDAPYADTTPEGHEGIMSERVMDVYNDTYGEPPREEVDLFDLQFGSGGEGGS